MPNVSIVEKKTNKLNGFHHYTMYELFPLMSFHVVIPLSIMKQMQLKNLNA